VLKSKEWMIVLWNIFCVINFFLAWLAGSKLIIVPTNFLFLFYQNFKDFFHQFLIILIFALICKLFIRYLKTKINYIRCILYFASYCSYFKIVLFRFLETNQNFCVSMAYVPLLYLNSTKIHVVCPLFESNSDIFKATPLR
jgi:hypothetical protein